MHKEIYYFLEKGECDFITFKNGAFDEAIQVCYELNSENLERELNGITEALEFFNKDEGTLVRKNYPCSSCLCVFIVAFQYSSDDEITM